MADPYEAWLERTIDELRVKELHLYQEADNCGTLSGVRRKKGEFLRRAKFCNEARISFVMALNKYREIHRGG